MRGTFDFDFWLTNCPPFPAKVFDKWSMLAMCSNVLWPILPHDSLCDKIHQLLLTPSLWNKTAGNPSPPAGQKSRICAWCCLRECQQLELNHALGWRGNIQGRWSRSKQRRQSTTLSKPYVRFSIRVNEFAQVQWTLNAMQGRILSFNKIIANHR